MMKVAKSCPILCDPMDYSLPGSSVHGILQARILQWVAIPSSRGSSRDWTQVSHTVGGFFNSWATREAPSTPMVGSSDFLTRCQIWPILRTRLTLPPPGLDTGDHSLALGHHPLLICPWTHILSLLPSFLLSPSLQLLTPQASVKGLSSISTCFPADPSWFCAWWLPNVNL